MNIVVCVKYVPDTEAPIRIRAGGDGIEESGLPFKLNYYDEHGVEEALRIKERLGGTVTVVTVGTPVDFPNFDTVRHHVYSFSPTKTFELKLYAGTPQAPVVFDKPGIAVLGCNIHDKMAAWVVVVDTPLHTRSAATGKAKIEGVAPGNYRLRVWHPGLAAAAEPTSMSLTVGTADVDQSITLNLGGLK